MKALVGAFNQEKALVGVFSVIVQPVVEPMEHYTALAAGQGPPAQLRPGGQARGVAAGHAQRRGGAGLHHWPGQAHLDTADPGQVQRELAHLELYLVYSCIVFVNNKLYLDRCTMVFQCSAIQSAIY